MMMMTLKMSLLLASGKTSDLYSSPLGAPGLSDNGNDDDNNCGGDDDDNDDNDDNDKWIPNSDHSSRNFFSNSS